MKIRTKNATKSAKEDYFSFLVFGCLVLLETEASEMLFPPSGDPGIQGRIIVIPLEATNHESHLLNQLFLPTYFHFSLSNTV
jgi:hypothetical protein